jgi:Fic family protein
MLYSIPSLSEEYLKVVDAIDGLRRRLNYFLQQQPRRWTGLLRRSTFARAIQASNSIEGYNVTVDDAIAAVEGEDPIDERTEAWLAVQGYRNALSYILQLATDPYFTHNEGTLRGLHYMMMSYEPARQPGLWRPGPIYVRREPAGTIVYEGPAAETVPPLVAGLVTALNDTTQLPVMVRAALAHLNLVMIHPFSDGNGRMARALQTLVLSREGLLDPTFSSIEEYLGHNTQAYYSVLAEVGQGAWHPERDPLPWIRFCLTAHYRQAETLLRRTGEQERLWNLLEAELRNRALNERLLMALSDAAVGYRVRNATYRRAADVSDGVATRDLALLVEQGMLVARGEKRGRHYVASEWLRTAHASVRTAKVMTDPFTGEQASTDPEPFRPSLP